MSHRSLKSAALALVVSLAIGSAAAAQSPNQLAISAAVPNLAAGTVTLTGANFTDRSDADVRVWLNRVPLAIQSASSTQVVATLPPGIGAGSYQLEMARSNGNANPNVPRYGAITLTIGAVGATGPQGPQGVMGPQGFTGSAGAQGPAGSTGAPGPAGASGPVGPAGPAGPAGADGAPGSVGPAGAVGATGPQGAPGAIGPQGLVGPTGAQGSPGLNGFNGAQGAQGLRGPGGVRGFHEFPYPGNHQFTVPADVSLILVEIWGAGGGGGTAGLLAPGGGGGGGGYVKTVLPVTAGQVLNVNVGTAGGGGWTEGTCGGSTARYAGWPGTSSSVANVAGQYVVAYGGSGGAFGDWLAGGGGAGGGWNSTWPVTAGLLARGGFGGGTGTTLGLFVGGGPTPTGSVGLPFGLGGGDGGWTAGCPMGGAGNHGMVLVSW